MVGHMYQDKVPSMVFRQSRGRVAAGTWLSPVRPVRRPLRPGNRRREGQSATPPAPSGRNLFSGGQCSSRKKTLGKRRSGEASCLETSLPLCARAARGEKREDDDDGALFY